MVRYRRRFEIIADILNAAEKGARKTRILRVANLSYCMLERYLDEAIKIGFLHFNENSYESTERGRAFLEKYRTYSDRRFKLEKEVERAAFEREVLERMCSFRNGNNAECRDPPRYAKRDARPERCL